MPRKARIDTPGALHHVIIRGIERGKIFRSDYDRGNFINRLGKLIPETQIDCFARVLIPNHYLCGANINSGFPSEYRHGSQLQTAVMPHR